MTDLTPLPDFNEHIRRVTQDGTEYFSLVDLMAVFSDTTQAARQYWSDTKKRLKQDGFEVSEKIRQLKLTAPDGKQRLTDCATGPVCLRIIQSIPSPKAEPVRQWFAGLGYERLEEIADPELGVQRAIDRAKERYLQQGKDAQWITTRLHGVDERKYFTDMLQQHISNMPDWGYGQATNELYLGLWGRDAKTLKAQAGIPERGNLRDHMHRIALHYQGIVESVIAHHLGQAETVTYEQALAIIGDIATLIGIQANQLSHHMGLDLPTNQPLLTSGE